MLRPILISTISLLGCTALFGQITNKIAPGAPGLDSHWPSAAKNGFHQINLSRKSAYTVTKTYTTDPRRPAILIDSQLCTSSNASYSLYVYFDPSLKNSGMHATGWSKNNAFLAFDADVASALVSSDRRETPGSAFRFGEGTGSATPLAWSMAQFIRLAISLQIGHNSETPAVVAARYAKRQGNR